MIRRGARLKTPCLTHQPPPYFAFPLEIKEQAFIAVAEASCRYIAPARYDDEILVRTTIERAGRRVMSFTYSIFNAETEMLLAEGRTVHVVIGKDGKPKSVPDRYYELLKA
ncbi:MAG: hypothetical protein HY646_07105 [Acidobacteria bacterium]|nr:hypothetical protein [Acidobacteriota bacterium]